MGENRQDPVALKNAIPPEHRDLCRALWGAEHALRHVGHFGTGSLVDLAASYQATCRMVAEDLFGLRVNLGDRTDMTKPPYVPSPVRLR